MNTLQQTSQLEIGPCVYLLHFKRPLGDLSNPRGQARHYMGSTLDIFGRLGAHRHGNGHARLMEVVHERGIDWELARVWSCDTEEEARALEYTLKGQHNGPRLCPICKEERKKQC